MISPAKLDKLPSEVVNLVQELQEQIIRDVCRRVTKANYLTPTAEWQLYKANQLRLSYNEVNKRIARQLKVRERTVRELYTETVKQALKEDAEIYRIATAMGKLPANTGARIDSYFRSAALSKLLSKGLKNSKGQLRNLCNSMAAEANRALSDAMDLAHLKVISGAYSYDDAIYSAVKELSDKGITRVTYPSGRRDNVDVCVRRAVLSSVNKSCCDIQLDLAREVGSRYVEVTAHIGARPSHAEWQGQIYSLEKGDPKYPYFYEATGYGTGEGLGGWNCRHNFFPYFEGIDTPYHTPDFSKTENNEYYALTQKQRGYERAVRDSKRKLAALDGARQTAEDPALKAKLDRDFVRRAVTLKNREARLEKFIKDNDLQRDNARVRVVGFGKSVSQKAVAAAKKQQISSTSIVQKLDNGGGSGIIKSSGKNNIPTSNHSYEYVTKIDPSNSTAINAILSEFEDKYRTSDIEHCRVITTNGEVYDVHGDKYTVNTTILGDKMIGSINEHNHVFGESQYSFSWEDLESYVKEQSSIGFAYDEKFRYKIAGYNKITLDEVYEAKNKAIENVYDRRIRGENIPDENVQHEMIKEVCKLLNIKYKRDSI